MSNSASTLNSKRDRARFYDVVLVTARTKHAAPLTEVLRRGIGSCLPADAVVLNAECLSGNGELERLNGRALVLVMPQPETILGNLASTVFALREAQARLGRIWTDATRKLFVPAAGRSTRSAAASPLGAKLFQRGLGGRPLIQEVIDRAKQLLVGRFNGTVILNTDEVFLWPRPFEPSERRILALGSEISLDDPKIESFGTVRAPGYQEGEAPLTGFFEKAPRAWYRTEQFGNVKSVPFSWGLYYLPTALQDAFLHRFASLVEGYPLDYGRGLFGSALGQPSSLPIEVQEASRHFAGQLGFVFAGSQSRYMHIGSVREYWEAFQSIFSSRWLRQLFHISIDGLGRVIGNESIIEPDVCVEAGAVVWGRCRLRSGSKVDAGAVLVDCQGVIHAGRNSLGVMLAGDTSAAVAVEEGHVRIEWSGADGFPIRKRLPIDAEQGGWSAPTSGEKTVAEMVAELNLAEELRRLLRFL